ncbi:DUF294 domain-containing protein [Paenibacillus sediminis]|uniref:CBS domain-containing protein n=1 Tax=Paenibacillus sediminis TaxID=664909 RepID=A0ABS4H5S9_9BACL|nr:DUF294 nucleotidyltransferase-like domain-containing protein [Paenibacillus sediminis]MBP1937737.1 CBS domain-containing protein [Paenibacillus sediminis]
MASVNEMHGNLPFQMISEAHSRSTLRARRIQFQSLLQQALSEWMTQDWMSAVNEMHDRIVKQAVIICEQEMIESGYGPPPVSYAFVAFGSGGRCEQTLWSDQDNGIIISDAEHPEKERYFRLFGQRLSDLLEFVGYPKCRGKVMCSEPLWCKTLTHWKQQLISWQSDYSWESVRYVTIASDLRYLAGDIELSKAWLRSFYEGFEGNVDLVSAVLRNTVKHKATLNILGQVVAERFGNHAGDFDVKYGVYIPLVNIVRYLALFHGVMETSTLHRVRHLMSLEAEPHPLLSSIERAFIHALRFRASTPYTVEEELFVSSDYLPQDEWKKKPTFDELRDSLLVVRRVHRSLQRRLRFAEGRRT